MWIGVTEAYSGYGEYNWSNSERNKLRYKSWGHRSPNYYNDNLGCAIINLKTEGTPFRGYWHDVDCYRDYPFTCQYGKKYNVYYTV